MASRQQILAVGAELRRRRDDRQLLHACRLGRHGGHQHGRRVRRRSARHADAGASQRPITLPQVAARPIQLHVVVQDGGLEIEHVLPDAAHGGQEFRPGLGMCGGQFLLRDANRFGRQLGLIDTGRIVEHGRQSSLADFAADPLDDLLRRERLAEDFDGPLPPRLADHIALWAQPLAQGKNGRAPLVAAGVDSKHVQRGGGHRKARLSKGREPFASSDLALRARELLIVTCRRLA